MSRKFCYAVYELIYDIETGNFHERTIEIFKTKESAEKYSNERNRSDYMGWPSSVRAYIFRD